MTWCEHKNLLPGDSHKTLPRDWCYEYHFESSKVLTCIYDSHRSTIGLASLKFPAPFVKSSGLLSFLHLQVHFPLIDHFLLGGTAALHVALWFSFHISAGGNVPQPPTTYFPASQGDGGKLMLLGKVCFVRSIVQPTGNILKTSKQK